MITEALKCAVLTRGMGPQTDYINLETVLPIKQLGGHHQSRDRKTVGLSDLLLA